MLRIFGVLLIWTCVSLMGMVLAQPQLAFAKTSHQFGMVERGKVVQVDFPFRNNGNAPLVIKEISPACGCTTSELGQTTYEPGASGQLPIQFDSQSFVGEVNKTIVVRSNDPMRPEVVLRISADVQALVNAVPSRVNFIDLSRRGKAQQVIRLETTRLPRLEIVDMRVDNPLYELHTQPINERKMLVRVSLDGSKAKPGKMHQRGTLTIQTNGVEDRLFAIDIPLFTKLQNPLTAEPSFVNFFNVDPNGDHHAEVQIHNDWPDPFNITGITSNSDMIRAEPVADDPQRIRITFTPNGFLSDGLVRAWVTLHTDLPEQPKVSLPIRIRMNVN